MGPRSGDAGLPHAEGGLSRVLSAPTLADAVRVAAGIALAPYRIQLLTAVVRSGEGLYELPGLRDAFAPVELPLREGGTALEKAWAAGVPVFRYVVPLGNGGELPATFFPLRGPDGVFGALLADEGTALQPAVDAAVDAVAALVPALYARWEAHAAREVLEASERRRDLYGGICDALADPVLVTDARNRILLENRRARSLFAAEAGDGEERRHRVEVNNYLFTSFLARPRPAATEARELTLVDPDSGAELLFEAVPAPLPAPQDATVSLLRDVTELRRAGHQLGHQVRRVQLAETRARSERDQLNLILAHVGAPIVVTDPRGAVMLMNREAQRLFRPGGAPGEGSSPAAVANADRFFAAVEAFASTGQPEQVVRIALRDPESGAELPAELTSGVIRDGDGAPLAVVSILHDLTHEVENARLAAELARVNEGLEQSIRE
ncbi:MAG TPA: PAS domain-containing protein, partial [Longimicrobium sp.]|nr:PAS domain-containing protein [Longimicrobium sp.]